MSKIGINISIDVTKIDKSRLFKGKKGTYMDLTTYEQHGFISQATTKEEREAGVLTPILGNCKVFFNSAEESPPQPNAEQGTPFDDAIPSDEIEDLPF